jgi:hypothetical protein
MLPLLTARRSLLFPPGCITWTKASRMMQALRKASVDSEVSRSRTSFSQSLVDARYVLQKEKLSKKTPGLMIEHDRMQSFVVFGTLPPEHSRESY